VTGFGLAIERDRAHGAIMVQIAELTVHVKGDVQRPGRYRWEIHDGPKLRDTSLHGFDSKRAAQLDGDAYLQKLVATWGVSNPGL
jgi:hypothetical protein